MKVEKRVVLRLPIAVERDGHDYAIRDADGETVCLVILEEDAQALAETLAKFITAGIEAVGQ